MGFVGIIKNNNILQLPNDPKQFQISRLAIPIQNMDKHISVITRFLAIDSKRRDDTYTI